MEKGESAYTQQKYKRAIDIYKTLINKFPNREEKYTRMGHGFSHMLQMVNDDIRKNVDTKEKEKEQNKIEDKEKAYKLYAMKEMSKAKIIDKRSEKGIKGERDLLSIASLFRNILSFNLY